MSLTIATAGTAAVCAVDASVQTISVTVTAGQILVIHCNGRDTTAPAVPTLTDDGAGALGSWTNVGTGVNGAVSTTNRQHVQYAVVNTGGTYTVTCTWQATILTLGIAAIKITGANAANPFGAQAAINATGTNTDAAAGTASALASTSNSRLLFVSSRCLGSCAPTTGWTELYDVVNGSEACGLHGYYLTSGASDDTTPNATLSNSVVFKASSVEVSVASGTIGAIAQYYSQLRG